MQIWSIILLAKISQVDVTELVHFSQVHLHSVQILEYSPQLLMCWLLPLLSLKVLFLHLQNNSSFLLVVDEVMREFVSESWAPHLPLDYLQVRL